MNFIEKADGRSKRSGGYHQWLKQKKARSERKKARKNPDCQPTYGKYTGWET